MKRRSFLKLSALTTASLHASKIEGVKDTIFDDKKVLVSDRFGPFYANINSSQIVSVTPFEGDKFPNTMNNCVPDRTQNESRVLYPCVRKSYLEGKKKNDLRGEEEFVRVSWEKALDLAAKALKDNFDKYGPEAIYGECYWWGGWGKISWGRTTAHRMLKILGGYVEESGDYSTGAGMVILPHIFGSNTVYEAPTTWKSILENAKSVVFWGTDPLVTNQIAVGTPTHTNYEYFTKLKELSKAGKIKTYSVDVYANNTNRYIKSKLISVRPNTDTAMMIGMCCYLYESGKYAKDFIKKYTVGFNKFKEYFMGENDGVKKDLAWASAICGVDVKTLKDLADDLCDNKSIIIAGRAIQRQDHGEQAHWMITILATMLGHIGSTGCGFEFSLGYYSQGADKFIAPTLKGLASVPSENLGDENSPWKKFENITIPSSRSIDAMLNPGKVIDQNGKKIKLPHIRVAFNASGSFFTRHQDVNRAVEGFKKVDTIITAEPFWTAQAKLSDIVLPVAIEPERYDIEASTNSEYIFLNKPVIEPMGESKSDFWICKEICKRWGVEEIFTEGKANELEWMKDIYNDALRQGKSLGYNMPSFDEALEAGFVRFDKVNKDTEYYTRLSDFVKNPHKYRLGTPSGKIEIYSPTIAKMGYDDCLGHPAWFEPFEWVGNKEQTKKHPLAVISPHSRFRLHSQLNNSLIRNYAEVNGREPMLIHPDTAKARGIKTGDIVRVYNDRGEILAGALVSDIVRADTIIICEGAWYDPEVYGKKSLCQHGCVNVLTRDKGTSKLAQSNTAHTTLVEVEKFKGVIKPLRAFSKPKIIQS